jgi:hypothetical protein
MRKSRFSEAQIIGILKELKAGKKASGWSWNGTVPKPGQ